MEAWRGSNDLKPKHMAHNYASDIKFLCSYSVVILTMMATSGLKWTTVVGTGFSGCQGLGST